MLKLHIIFLHSLFLIVPKRTQNRVSMNIAAAITEHHFLVRKISTKGTLPSFVGQTNRSPNSVRIGVVLHSYIRMMATLLTHFHAFLYIKW